MKDEKLTKELIEDLKYLPDDKRSEILNSLFKDSKFFI